MHVDRATGQIWFSPSDVTTYLASRWVFAQALAVARGERERWSAPDDGTGEITRKRGGEHEADYLAQLKSAGLRVTEIPRAKTQGEWDAAVEQTRAAVTDAEVDVIYQAHFTLGGSWRGQADFLERNGDGVFEPVDTKLARRVKPYMVHQLCFYADALAELQDATPLQVHAVLGDGTRETLSTNDYVHIARETRGALERFAMSDEPARTYPWPSEQLELTGLAEEAELRWREDDHPLLIAGVTRKQIEKLARAGITTAQNLADAKPEQRPADIAERTWERLTRQARLQKTDPPTWELLRPEEKRGLALLRRPSPGDVFYDIEGDPLWDSAGSLEYLHGLWWIDPETDQEVFNPLWAHDREQEKAAFEKLIEIFVSRRAAYPDMHIYHYAPYETTALKRLASTHGTCEEELDDLLRGEVFIDLYQVVRQGLQASVENYSIKSMERFYMEAREASVKEGGASIVEYERYRELAGTPEGDAILEAIGLYNEEDCRSTYLLREWLRKRHRDAVKEFGFIQEPEPAKESEDRINASPMSGEPSRGELHRNKLLLARTKLELAAADEPDPTRAQAMRLLAEVLMFHVRENKSVWWSFYGHQSMTIDELIADREAIGGLQPLDPADRSSERTFTFPAQDYKVRRDDRLRDPIHDWEAGKVVEVDDRLGQLTIELASNALSLLPEAVFPFKHIGKEPLDLAIIDLADSLIEGNETEFAAIKRFFLLEKPLYGEDLTGGNLKALREQLLDLEGSYMIAQGPPGCGKTFAAADLIVDQLIRGKRVGITAGTHLAVNNLCCAVERQAVERGHVFSGVKKDGDNSQFEGETGHIVAVTKNEAAAPGVADLTAGTPWLFSRPEWREQLDLIVIDEAGQFSLAAALAVGTAARTVLMVGDPNQLPQVVQGSHPPGSGASALEHAIGGHRTIPRDMGVFLPESWRMTPELCSFVSDTFYEGRLGPNESVRELAPPRGQALKYMPVAHEGNRQSSAEEAAAVAFEIQSLEGAGVAPEDVMVVAPYNMQVERLRCEIDARVSGGEGVRVLTVDKCQGQEAEVVFFSLATSGGESVPRGLEFLFSANRFNVAISRARRASYLVCSPELLAVDARSVNEMRLADAFLAFVERAERVAPSTARSRL